MAKNLLAEMTWPEAREAFSNTRLIIVPIGSMEQHGPHMPLGTDWIVAQHLGNRAGQELDAIVTPVIPIGFAAYHTDFAGTLSTTVQTLAQYVSDIVGYLVKYGATHVIFINGHGGNEPSLTQVARQYRDKGVAVADIMWWEVAGYLNHKWALIGHGDILETSMMLALNPDAVDLSKARVPINKYLTPNMRIEDGGSVKFGPASVRLGLRTMDTSDTGDMIEYGHSAHADYTISPAGATKEMGKEVLNALVKYIVDFGKEFMNVHFDPVK